MELNGELIARHSSSPDDNLAVPPSEASISNLISQGRLSSVVIVPMDNDSIQRNLHFLIGVKDGTGVIRRIIWGQTTMDENPYNLTWINALKALDQDGGSGQIISESGEFLYQTDPKGVLRPYQGTRFTTPTYFEGKTFPGNPGLHYYQPISNLDWAVMTSVPTLVLHEKTWTQTYPVLIIAGGSMLLVLIIAMGALWPLFKDIRQINLLSSQATKGELDVQLTGSQAKAEMGRLFGVVGGMFKSLRSRLRDQQQLLEISKTLDQCDTLEETVQTILKAAMTMQISTARIVLKNPAGKSLHGKIEHQYGLGDYASELASLDEDILEKLQRTESLFLNNSQVSQGLAFGKQIPQPTALSAHPLKAEDLPLVRYGLPTTMENIPTPQSAVSSRNLLRWLQAQLKKRRCWMTSGSISRN